MLNIGPQELLIILVIALVVVGPQRLPALGRSIGKGLREIRRAQDDVRRTIHVDLDALPSDDGSRPLERGGPRPRTEPSGPPDPLPRPIEPDPPPSASEPLPASEVREISRTLGRSVAELRRAKEEVRRSFRIGGDDGAGRTAPSSERTRTPPEGPAEGSGSEPPDEISGG